MMKNVIHCAKTAESPRASRAATKIGLVYGVDDCVARQEHASQNYQSHTCYQSKTCVFDCHE